MPSLVINAPENQVKSNNKKSFEDTLKSGKGEGYVIYKSILSQIQPGCTVILLCKDNKRRAEGKLIKLEPVTKILNSIM